MSKIPCIENKCLVYPTCQYKKEVHCDDMYSWYRYSGGEASWRWRHVHEKFPNIEEIGESTIIPPRTLPYIITMKRKTTHGS